MIMDIKLPMGICQFRIVFRRRSRRFTSIWETNLDFNRGNNDLALPRSKWATRRRTTIRFHKWNTKLQVLGLSSANGTIELRDIKFSEHGVAVLRLWLIHCYLSFIKRIVEGRKNWTLNRGDKECCNLKFQFIKVDLYHDWIKHIILTVKVMYIVRFRISFFYYITSYVHSYINTHTPAFGFLLG